MYYKHVCLFTYPIIFKPKFCNMQQIILSLLLCLAPFITLFAQYTTVQFNLEKNYFNEGQPLPAERPLMFTGSLPAGAELLEISILPEKAKASKEALYTAIWKQQTSNNNGLYNLAVNYPLRSSSNYDFKFQFFRPMSANERAELGRKMAEQVIAYTDAGMRLGANKMTWASNKRRLLNGMNQLVEKALDNYRNPNDVAFPGFSVAIAKQLDQMDSESPLGKDSADLAAWQSRLEQQQAALHRQITTELDQIMTQNWLVLSADYYIDNYETEQKQRSFALNIGYGGVYLSGQFDDLTYGDAPYLGLAFPLSNSNIAPKLLRNSSVTLGTFIQNFTDAEGNEVSGVVVNRPIYLGLDYKLFQFVRFNAGAALLESSRAIIDANGMELGMDRQIFIRPFIGLSARIDLSIQLGK